MAKNWFQRRDMSWPPETISPHWWPGWRMLPRWVEELHSWTTSVNIDPNLLDGKTIRYREDCSKKNPKNLRKKFQIFSNQNFVKYGNFSFWKAVGYSPLNWSHLINYQRLGWCDNAREGSSSLLDGPDNCKLQRTKIVPRGLSCGGKLPAS